MKVMMSSNVLYFPGRAVDIVSHHHIHGHWSSNGEVTQGGRIPPPPLPAILDSKKRGLLRVKVMVYQMSFFKCSDLKFKENIKF